MTIDPGFRYAASGLRADVGKQAGEWKIREEQIEAERMVRR
jgi:hypothetical protein